MGKCIDSSDISHTMNKICNGKKSEIYIAYCIFGLQPKQNDNDPELNNSYLSLL